MQSVAAATDVYDAYSSYGRVHCHYRRGSISQQAAEDIANFNNRALEGHLPVRRSPTYTGAVIGANRNALADVRIWFQSSSDTPRASCNSVEPGAPYIRIHTGMSAGLETRRLVVFEMLNLNAEPDYALLRQQAVAGHFAALAQAGVEPETPAGRRVADAVDRAEALYWEGKERIEFNLLPWVNVIADELNDPDPRVAPEMERWPIAPDFAAHMADQENLYHREAACLEYRALIAGAIDDGA